MANHEDTKTQRDTKNFVENVVQQPRDAASLALLLVVDLGGWYAYRVQQPVAKVMSEKVTLPGQKSTLILSGGTQIHEALRALRFPI